MTKVTKSVPRFFSSDSISDLDALHTPAERRRFLLNLICFAACIEGLFFFAAFAYVYFLRSRGLLHGLATGTNWVFRDESPHMAFAFEIVRVARAEEPELFDADLERAIISMLEEAINCELAFADDLLSSGVLGLTRGGVRQYLEHVADQRLMTLGIAPRYGRANPFPFMALQDVQELAIFFLGVPGRRGWRRGIRCDILSSPHETQGREVARADCCPSAHPGVIIE
jgi:ribonucleoside-diphosphate reductase beta chain